MAGDVKLEDTKSCVEKVIEDVRMNYLSVEVLLFFNFLHKSYPNDTAT